MIPITSLCMLTITTLSVPSLWEGIRGLKPAQIIVLFKICFISCPALLLYVGLSHALGPCPALDCLAEEAVALCSLSQGI